MRSYHVLLAAIALTYLASCDAFASLRIVRTQPRPLECVARRQSTCSWSVMQAQHHKGDSKLQTLDAFKASCGALLVSLALASPVSANELTLEPSYHKVTRSDIMHMSIDKRPSVGVTNPSEAAEEAVDSVRMMIKRAGEGEEGSSKEVYSKKIRKDFLAEKEGASVSPAELGAGALKLIALWVPVLGLLSFLSKEETLDNSNMQGIAKVATVVAVPVNVLISGFLVPNADWHRIQDVLSLIVITGIAALPSFAMWAYTQGVYNWVQQEDEQD